MNLLVLAMLVLVCCVGISATGADTVAYVIEGSHTIAVFTFACKVLAKQVLLVLLMLVVILSDLVLWSIFNCSHTLLFLLLLFVQ